MSLIQLDADTLPFSFPRLRGDEPWAGKERPTYPAFSPPTRG